MTEVSTHLFYGLFVSTSSLLIGSKAFVKVQSPFLAIDLILVRQKKNRLLTNTSNNSNAVFSGPTITLPEEVWNMIKKELIGIELIESEKEIVFGLLCEHCKKCCNSCCFDLDESTPWSPPMTWEELIANSILMCDECFELQANKLRGDNIWTDTVGFKENVTALLDAYKLETIGFGIVGGNSCFDINSLTPIGIIRSVDQECHDFEEYTPYHAITSISPSDFELPFSVEFISRQFQSLARDYGIEFKDHKTKTIRSQKHTTISTETKKGEEKKEKMNRGVDSTSVPGWKLWTEGMNRF